ncbi:MAG: lytic transglycosylase domain-containing protein [Lachnospiraceae bacterium]|nr:lytic transglycosylase domain-containing protein [Lachnospiraceae bacterium]
MSTITSIDQVRPSNGQDININQNTATGFAGNTYGTFRTALDQAVLDQVREDKISSSDHGQYDAIFEQASACYNLPVALLKAITKVESDFNPYDVSSAGAKGLMQLMPSTAAEVGVTDPFDPWQNIMGATKYIRKQLDRFGDLRTALAAYNTGPGNVKKYGGEPDYCKRYVDKVLAYMGEAQVDTSSVGAAYDVLANQGNSSYNMFGSPYGLLGNQGGSYSMFGSLGNLYGMSAGLGNVYGMSGGFGMLGSLGSYYGTQGSSSGLLGSWGSGLGLLSNSSGYASVYGLSGLLSTGSSSGDDTVTLSKEGFNSLIELMRIQMMMGAEQTVGTMSLL